MMGATVDRAALDTDEEHPLAKIPRPIEGGSYTEQSLGRWIDRSMGDRRHRREAAEELEPFLMSPSEMTPDPVLVDAPEPFTDGDPSA
jgi:hypothetical protein